MPFELSGLSGTQGRRERVAVALAFLAWLGGNSAGLWEAPSLGSLGVGREVLGKRSPCFLLCAGLLGTLTGGQARRAPTVISTVQA